MSDLPGLESAANAAIRAAQDSADEQMLYTAAGPIAAWLAEALTRGASAKEIATHLLAAGADPAVIYGHLSWGAFLVAARAAEVAREIAHPEDESGGDNYAFALILAPFIPILQVTETTNEAARALVEDFGRRHAHLTEKGLPVAQMLRHTATAFAELMAAAIALAEGRTP